MNVATHTLDRLGGYGYFFVDCVRSSMRYGVPWGRVLEEAYKIGVRSFPVLATMAIFVGTNLAIQGYAALASLGAQNMVGMFVALAGVREIGPLLAATMVAAKAGTEMTAQLAVMRTKEQIDALEVMAVDPRAELITPSLLAILGVLPALTIISLFLSIGSALAVSVGQLGVGAGDFLSLVLGNMTGFDLIAAMAKSLVFGAIIATVSGYFGFFSEKGPEGVGKSTNQAVVVMCIACISTNFLLTAVLYG